MVSCRYQDYQANEIPSVSKDGATVRVMAGESLGTTGPIKLRNPGFLLDVTLQKGGHFVQPVPAEWTSFAYVCQGSGRLGSTNANIEQVWLTSGLPPPSLPKQKSAPWLLHVMPFCPSMACAHSTSLAGLVAELRSCSRFVVGTNLVLIVCNHIWHS